MQKAKSQHCNATQLRKFAFEIKELQLLKIIKLVIRYRHNTKERCSEETSHFNKKENIMANEKSTLAAVLELLGRADAEGASRKSEWITVEEAVKRFKVSRWTLLRWRKKGWISAKKLGTAKAAKVLVNAETVELFLATLGDSTVERIGA